MARAAPRSGIDGVVFGFDPGGSKRFGNGIAAIRAARGRVEDATFAHFESVDASVAWAQRQFVGAKWLGLGVDTLLAWSGSKSGWRAADLALRAAYPEVSSCVVSPNGLYGSMCLGGPLLASCLRRTRPDLPLFETHPKVLYFHLNRERYDWSGAADEMWSWLESLLALVGLRPFGDDSEDAFDALLSAYAAMEALAGTWKTDLYELSRRGELVHPVSGPAPRYPWPERVSAPNRDYE